MHFHLCSRDDIIEAYKLNEWFILGRILQHSSLPVDITSAHLKDLRSASYLILLKTVPVYKINL